MTIRMMLSKEELSAKYIPETEEDAKKSFP